MPVGLSGSMQRYLAGNKVYRHGSYASHIGVKDKTGFKQRSRKQARLRAMKRRLQGNK